MQSLPPSGASVSAGSAQQAHNLLIANGINPDQLTPSQFNSFIHLNPGVQQRSIQVYTQSLAQHNRTAQAQKTSTPPTIAVEGDLSEAQENSQNLAHPNSHFLINSTISQDETRGSRAVEQQLLALFDEAVRGLHLRQAGSEGGNMAVPNSLQDQQAKEREMLARQKPDHAALLSLFQPDTAIETESLHHDREQNSPHERQHKKRRLISQDDSLLKIQTAVKRAKSLPPSDQQVVQE
jgi:hypothetical protein